MLTLDSRDICGISIYKKFDSKKNLFQNIKNFNISNEKERKRKTKNLFILHRYIRAETRAFRSTDVTGIEIFNIGSNNIFKLRKSKKSQKPRSLLEI